eukprot:2778390-Lingulodinium_polyedra.AAC.1
MGGHGNTGGPCTAGQDLHGPQHPPHGRGSDLRRAGDGRNGCCSHAPGPCRACEGDDGSGACTPAASTFPASIP